MTRKDRVVEFLNNPANDGRFTRACISRKLGYLPSGLHKPMLQLQAEGVIRLRRTGDGLLKVCLVKRSR